MLMINTAVWGIVLAAAWGILLLRVGMPPFDIQRGEIYWENLLININGSILLSLIVRGF